MLTSKQELFVQNLVKGMSQREAYKSSYNAKNMKDTTIDKKASELFHKGEIRGRYNELVKQLESTAIMDAKDRMQWLTKIVKGEIKEKYTYWSDGEQHNGEREADLTTKIKAIDTLNKMDNSYQQNINVKGSIDNAYSKLTDEQLRRLAGDT